MAPKMKKHSLGSSRFQKGSKQTITTRLNMSSEGEYQVIVVTKGSVELKRVEVKRVEKVWRWN